MSLVLVPDVATGDEPDTDRPSMDLATHATMSEPHYRSARNLEAAGFAHAFFLRGGGLSAGPYHSLNFSWAVGDDEQKVRGNLGRAARVLGVPPARVYFLSQVHGADTVALRGDEAWENVLRLEGDALLARSGGLACAVRTADCAPILLGDPHSGAAAAVHAGWRGLVAGVLGRAVEAMAQMSAKREQLVAAIGPCIGVNAFEVSEDVAQQLADCVGSASVVRRDLGPKPHVDLRAVARTQLSKAGVTGAQVEDVPGCTYTDTSDHFSYRRDGRASGRHLAAIVPRPSAPPP